MPPSGFGINEVFCSIIMPSSGLKRIGDFMMVPKSLKGFNINNHRRSRWKPENMNTNPGGVE